MKKIQLDELDIYKVGNTIEIAGAIWTGEGKTFLCLFPEEKLEELVLLQMSLPEWEKFIRQTDLLETKVLQQGPKGITKAIVRKSQRQIDMRLQWRVFKQNNYMCQYCGKSGLPLTVDHCDLWEKGGCTREINLLSACRKCNKLRGNMEYEEWINSETYKKVSKHLPDKIRQKNLEKIKELEYIKTLRVKNIRSR